MALPQGLTLDQTQNTWASILDPVVGKPWNQGQILEGIVLKAGVNTVSHKLGRKLGGWIPTRVKASATIYDTQDTNPTPALTLVLVASADVTVNLLVF